MKLLVPPGVLLAIALAIVPKICLAQSLPADARRQAFSLEQSGDSAGAETAWRELLKIQPASAEAYAHLGLLNARQERYTEAVPLYRKAMVLSPNMPGLRLNLGLALFKAGAMKEAVETFTPLLTSQTTTPAEAQRLHVLIGMAWFAAGEYASAVPHLRVAAAHDPSSLELRMSLAQSCMASRQFPCVMDTYREILQLNADSAEADMLAGEALDEMKDEPGAVQQFRAAVKTNPKEPNVHFGLGYLLWKLKQFPEAAQEFRAELANAPGYALAMTYLGDSDMRLQDREAALPLLTQATRIEPTIALAHLDLGVLYADAGAHEDALRELRTAASLAPTQVDVHWRLARLYQSMGRKDEAKAELDKTRNLQKTADDSVFQALQISHNKKLAERALGKP